MNIFLEREEPKGSGQNVNAKVLDPKAFLNKEMGGYCNGAKEFLESGEDLRIDDYEYLKTFYSCLKKGLKIIQTSNTKVDKGNKPYKFITFLKSKRATEGVKLIVGGYIDQVLEDYQNGLLEITFTLDELILEAKKS